MTPANVSTVDGQPRRNEIQLLGSEPGTTASAVAWGAILAGAAAAAALSLVLLLLGTGLGLSAASPWSERGVQAATLGIAGILWITLTQLAASGLGGYLAGRLRTRWSGVHADETYFRDTAHGLLAWAIATLGTAALLATTVTAIVSGGAQVVSAGAGAAAATGVSVSAAATPAADANDSTSPYFVDSLFRSGSAPASDAATAAAASAEAARIFAAGLRDGALPADDTRYLGQLVAQRTGLAAPDAEKRVTDTFARLQHKLNEAKASAKEAADKARKASAWSALWLVVSLLIGAFFASLAATFGGRQRDL